MTTDCDVPVGNTYDKVEYELAEGVGSNVFKTVVDQLCAEGWRPLGGVAVTHTPEYQDLVYTQAMVRGTLIYGL